MDLDKQLKRRIKLIKQRKDTKVANAFICIGLVGMITLMIGCGSRDYTSEERADEKLTDGIIRLTITEQAWSGRTTPSGEMPYFEPEITQREIVQGDVIYLRDLVIGEEVGSITILGTHDGYILVYFENNGIAPIREGGTINLLWQGNWTSEIEFAELYNIATTTMSSGITWTLLFE